jgi:hypothetical protein
VKNVLKCQNTEDAEYPAARGLGQVRGVLA